MQEPADSEEVADIAVAAWRDVWLALSPIVGTAGTAALYQRCLSLRIAEYPWLANLSEQREPGEFDTLRAELSQQTKADAGAANAALLQSLSQILANLIGAPLAGRLLQRVSEKHDYTTQDSSK